MPIKKRRSTQELDDPASRKKSALTVDTPAPTIQIDNKLSPDSQNSFEELGPTPSLISIPKSRIFRLPRLGGEPEKSWGRCCHCGEEGEIMSRAQCTVCFHTQCVGCEDSRKNPTLSERMLGVVQLCDKVRMRAADLEGDNPRQDENGKTILDDIDELQSRVVEMDDNKSHSAKSAHT